MASLAEDILAVKELIEDPAHWCQNFSARTIDGRRVSADHDAAVCWCMGGACMKVAEMKIPWTYLLVGLINKAIESLELPTDDGWAPIVFVNDHNDHDTIMRVMTRAHEIAVESEQ